LQLDPHDTRKKIERATQAIHENEKISDTDKKHVLKFDEFLAAKGLSEKRRLVYLRTLPRIRQFLKRNFRAASKQDIIKLMSDLERTDLEDWTKHTYSVCTKRFYQWLHGLDGSDYPPQVSWIHSRKNNRRHVLPEELLDDEDIQKLVAAGENDPRDKALITTLYESGCRVGEILSLRIRHVSFDEFGAVLRVSGKTGERRVRVVSSAPLLASWLTHHPNREDREAPLWTQSKNEPLTYDAARMMLHRRAKSAGIRKQVNPHMFRHSQASRLANDLTEAQMNEYFGWMQGSKMPAVYVHMSGRNVDQRLLEIKGVKIAEKEEARPAVKACLRCGHVNPPTGRYCMKCALPLDLKAALEVEEKRRRADGTMSRLLEDPEVQKVVVKKIRELGLADSL